MSFITYLLSHIRLKLWVRNHKIRNVLGVCREDLEGVGSICMTFASFSYICHIKSAQNRNFRRLLRLVRN